MTTEELLIKISGDSSGGVTAVQTLGSTMKSAFTEGGQAAASSGEHLSQFGELAMRVAERLTVYEVLKKLLDFTKEALQSTAALEDLSRATGISTDGLQRLNYVGQEFGVGSDVMARAVEQLSSKLATGDKSATSAVQALGLSVQDLLAMGPEEAFTTVAEAAGGIQDPMLKAGVASELFGGRLSKQLLPFLGELREKLNAVPRDAIISDDNISRAHDFEVGLEHLETRLKAWSVTAVGAIRDGATAWYDFFNQTRTLSEHEQEAVDRAAASFHAHAAATDVSTERAKLLQNTLDQLRKDALQPIDAQTKSYIQQLDAAGKSTQEISRLTGINETALANYLKGLKATTAEAKQLQTAIAGIDLTKKIAELDAAVTHLGGTTGLTNGEMQRAGDEAAKLRNEGGTLTAQLLELAHVHDLVALAAAHHRAEETADAAALRQSGKAVEAFLTNLHLGLLQRPDLTHAVPLIDVDAVQQAADTTKKIAATTFNDIVGRMHAQGVETQAVLEQEAASAREQFQSMAASGKFTADELEAAWARYVAAAIAGGHSLSLQFKEDLSHLGAAVLEAFASGGNIGEALTSGAKGLGADVSKNLLSGTVKDLAKDHPEMSKALSEMAGPLGGAVVTLGLELGKKLWNALFGTAGRDTVKDFAASMGGFDTLHTKLDALGASGEQLWVTLTQGVGKNDPAAAKAVIDQITKALDAQKQATDDLLKTQNDDLASLLKGLSGFGASTLLQPYLDKLGAAKGLTADNLALLQQLGGDGKVSFDEMKKAADALGISTDHLGGAFQAARAQADWQSIIDNLDTLVRGGANLNELLGDAGLQKKMSDLVSSSIKFGTEIPANAKPWIQSLVDQGKLLDDNGTKITDTSKLKFGGDLETSLQTLIDKIGILIDKMSTGLPDAIRQIPPKITTTVEFHGERTGDWPDGSSGGTVDDVRGASTGAYVTPHGLVPLHFAAGGLVPFLQTRGPVTDPIPAYLRPGEVVLNAAQQGRVADAIGGAGQPIIVEVHHQTVLGGEVVDQRVERVGAKALNRGRWQVGTRTVKQRTY